MIKLVNCKDLFRECFIDDVKDHIDTYHQGFVLIGSELYIPLVRVNQLDLKYDKDVDTVMLEDLSQTTATDNTSYDLSTVLDLCHDSYWQGYDDGFKA